MFSSVRVQKMPFTHFHIGPLILLGFLLWRYLDFRVLVASGVLIDVRASLVYFDILRPPVHGLLHTYPVAALIGIGIGAMVFIYDTLHLPGSAMQPAISTQGYFLAGITGGFSHIIMDALTSTQVQLLPGVQTVVGSNHVFAMRVFCTSCFLCALIYTQSSKNRSLRRIFA